MNIDKIEFHIREMAPCQFRDELEQLVTENGELRWKLEQAEKERENYSQMVGGVVRTNKSLEAQRDALAAALRDILSLIAELKDNLRLLRQADNLTAAENTTVVVLGYTFWDASTLGNKLLDTPTLGVF